MCAFATVIPAAFETLSLAEPATRGYGITLTRSMKPSWLELEIQRVAQAGFNLILFPVYVNGWTLFPSESAAAQGIKPINPHIRKWNPLDLAGRLAAEAGITLWGFTRPYNFHPRHSIVEHKLLHEHPEWRIRAHPNLQQSAVRRREAWHPCLINPDYRRYVGNVLSEAVAGYQLRGLVINLADLGICGGPLRESPFCFCPACRRKFREDRDEDLLQAAERGQVEMIRQWQLEQVLDHVSYVRHRLLRMRPGLRLVCRARPTWRQQADRPTPTHCPSPLVDWTRLLESGLIELIAVDHDDERAGELIGSRLAADYANLGDRVLWLPVLSIDALEDLRAPLRALQHYPTPGFIAEFQNSFTEDDARFLSESFFPDAAVVPEDDPIRTATYFLERAGQAHRDLPRLSELIGDFVRLLARQVPSSNEFKGLQMIEQNIHGLEQYIRRGRLGRGTISERTLLDLGLARRYVRMALMDIRMAV